MATPSKAVFLSYASEDGAAAKRISDALRTAGIEVWFDQSELRGGDVWDRQIRKQIQDCALFMPVVSAHSQARLEGYFRREWKLAADRTHDMAEEKAFLVPVVIDDTSERYASVPDKFRDVQWTHLPAGETSAAFIERVVGLLSTEAGTARHFAELPSASSKGPVANARVRSGRPRASVRKWMRMVGIAAAATIVLLPGYLGLEWLNRWKAKGPATASIAVLPLSNESGEASQQYFSDGISEDLITALSQFPGLKVIGRISSFQFRDAKEDGHSIGAKLGVAHLLEGSVRRSGEMVRVSAELIDTTDGSTQWSERYDRPYKDLFALQDEITRAVTGALRAKLLTGEQNTVPSERPPGGSLEAYNAQLQGQYYFYRNTEQDYRKAIDFYTQATQLDSHYALAWSGLARAWTDLSAEFLGDAPARDAFSKAREAVDRALALSPDLAAAHIAKGHLLQSSELDWRGAEAEFRRGLALAPQNAEAKLMLGTQLATFGDLESAVELTRQALATEPLRATWYSWLAGYYLGLSQLDNAELAVGKAIELQPAGAGHRYTLTIIEIQRGNAQAALRAAQQEVPGPYRDVETAFALQIGGDRVAAETALRRLIEKEASTSAYQIAMVYALRNDDKATFEWLDRAWSNRDSGLSEILFDPIFVRYRNDPRFAALCHKVGLPAPAELGK